MFRHMFWSCCYICSRQTDHRRLYDIWSKDRRSCGERLPARPLGRYQRARYLIGMDARLMVLIQALPKWLGDCVLELFTRKVPLPAVLQKRR